MTNTYHNYHNSFFKYVTVIISPFESINVVGELYTVWIIY